RLVETFVYFVLQNTSYPDVIQRHKHQHSAFNSLKSAQPEDSEFDLFRYILFKNVTYPLFFFAGFLWQTNEKKIIFGQVISMYLNMLNNLRGPKDQDHVTTIIEAMEYYKQKYNEGLKKADDLIELSKLPLNETKMQRKAVAELYQVVEKLHAEQNQRKRRSRSPKLCKPHFRG
uniref:Uncharacterized protein n=1 Tax=Salvator merianae TaxID=96440 RepID=A0A8D0DUR1_SALMN